MRKKKQIEPEKNVICLPYIGLDSLVYKKKLIKIYKRLGNNISVVFTSFKIKNYFSLKDKTPLALRANVVYKYNCACDEHITYIGKTTRHLAIRANEHLKGNSAISDHLGNCHAPSFDISRFNVLACGNSDFEIKIKEALLIQLERPSLNCQLSHSGSSFLLNVF